ncbi:DUF6233 domain-containing protein [Streptomyces sp. NPDC090083]|uniref:DUF6233 domain-containing protein n=1 Tax=Streptomyces sp. NPDC090083 TaxID=3365941 RepID=UPI003825CD77
MSDNPSRLELLHFARRVVVQQATTALAQLDEWIAAEERREAESRKREAARPAPPDWVVERGPDRKAVVAVHRGHCWGAGRYRASVTRAQAVEVLQQQVPACPECRPDAALGLLG